MNKITRVAIVVAKEEQDAANCAFHEHDAELVVAFVHAHMDRDMNVVFCSCVGRGH